MAPVDLGGTDARLHYKRVFAEQYPPSISSPKSFAVISPQRLSASRAQAPHKVFNLVENFERRKLDIESTIRTKRILFLAQHSDICAGSNHYCIVGIVFKVWHKKVELSFFRLLRKFFS